MYKNRTRTIASCTLAARHTNQLTSHQGARGAPTRSGMASSLASFDLMWSATKYIVQLVSIHLPDTSIDSLPDQGRRRFEPVRCHTVRLG